MTSAAFFDLDNTLVRGSSLFFLARQLVREGIVSRKEIVRFAWFEIRFVLTRSENRSHRDVVTSKALAIVAGYTTQEVSRVISRATTRLLNQRLVPSIVAELREHQRLGRPTFLITASPVELAADLASKLGMTGAIATTPEIVNGVYTGRLVGEPMHGQRKASAVLELAQRHQLDLGMSFAYSDSQNDVPLLSCVGHSAVVHANRRLCRLARSRGWKVLPAGRGWRDFGDQAFAAPAPLQHEMGFHVPDPELAEPALRIAS